MRHFRADAEKLLLPMVLIGSTQFGNSYLVGGYGFQNALLSIHVDDGAQHVMELNHLTERCRQLAGLERPAFELEVNMSGYRTQFNLGAATNPVSVLYIIQRKWLVTLLLIRNDLRNFILRRLDTNGLQHLKQNVLLLADRLLQFGG